MRAGPLSLTFDRETASVRRIRLGDREVLRGIYAAVRDRHWGTVEPRVSIAREEIGEDSFDLAFDVECREGESDFVWRGHLSGDADGTIRFAMDGRARSSFLRNRIGICVLHPIIECAGHRCTVEKVDGRIEEGIFPIDIAPHQPFQDVRAIAHEVSPGVRAEVRFEGDVFEMEDQRNWTDASYKTYSTPLALPFPVRVNPGDEVRQAVTLRLLGETAGIGDPRRADPSHARRMRGVQQVALGRSPSLKAVTVTISDLFPGALPRIGLCVASHGETLGVLEIERLRALHLSHLRVDLAMRAGDWRRALRQAAAEANAIGATLEAAIHLSAEPERDLADLVDEFTRTHPPVSMWLVFREGEPATSERTARLARERLDRFPAARIGGGTDRHFAELNRNRPPADLLDAISYSVNPQVHTFDDASLVETFLGQGETVRSARAFSKGREIAVTPITLRPRSHPDPTRRSADPRQATCFGAGWTLGSLASLGCASSVTFYETTGPLGVMGHGSGAVFPLYHVLADAGEFAGGRFVPTISSDSHRVASLALTEGGRFRLLIANLRPDDTIVRIRDLGFGPSVWIRSLDAGSLEEAMRRPQAFRADPGQLRDADPEELEVMLAGHAVARIDVEAEPAP